MAIKSRLNRLETIVAAKNEPGWKTFEEAMADWVRLWDWLDERGYKDCLAALEAGETGPEGLEELLREYAAYDPKHRAWARIEAALDAGELPDDADLEMMQAPRPRCPTPTR
jgi:hypothetical protein